MKIHHLAISVKSLEKSIEFYQQFGFREVKRFTKEGWDGEAVFLESGSFRLELFCFEDCVENEDDFSNFKVLGYKHILLKLKISKRSIKN